MKLKKYAIHNRITYYNKIIIMEENNSTPLENVSNCAQIFDDKTIKNINNMALLLFILFLSFLLYPLTHIFQSS